jgi:glucokinase
VTGVADRYIGVDVGGTKIATAILEGERLEAGEIEPTDPGGADALLEQIARLVERHRTSATRAVGIGLPSVIDFETGTVRHTVNLPLANVPVRSRLSELLGLPVVVENDASCAALAEAHDGPRLVCPELVMFTIGTGVGGGLVLGGRLYRGATGAAAELGHTLIGLCVDDGVPAPAGGFPKPGSLEALAAGRALDRIAISCAREEPNGRLGKRFADVGSLTGHDVVEAARDGDEQALAALGRLGERLGVGIANAINTFDPLEVVIGGGVSVAGELLLAPARRVAQSYVVPGIGTKTRIRLARHGPQAGVLGAALNAAHEHGEG